MKSKIKLFFILICLFNISNIAAQEPSWEWVVHNASAKSMSIDKWGNYYKVGDFNSKYIVLGGDTLYNSNQINFDMYIVKYNSEGKLLWLKGAKGSGDESASSVATDAVGNLYVAGEFNSLTMIIGTDTIRKLDPNGCDVFLIKYNTEGKVIWARSAGGGHCYTNTRSICIDKDANIYMSGFFQSNTATFDTIVLQNYVQSPECTMFQYCDLFIAKFDSSGKVVWAKSAGGIDFDYAFSIHTDNLGYLYMCGTFYSTSITFDTITLYKNNHPNNLFTVKYDTDGNVKWAKRTGSNNHAEDYALCVNTDAFGSVYVVGGFSGDTLIFASDTLINTSLKNFLVLKYDRAGNEIWARAAIKNNNSVAKSVAIDTSNNVYVAGTFNRTPFTLDSIDIPNNNKTDDIYLIKYNENGRIIWYKIMGGVKNDNVTSLVIDDLGNFYMSGSTSDGAKFDTINITKSMGFTAKLSINPTVNTNISKDNNTIELYPNPNDGSFFVDLPYTGKIYAEVYNILGNKIFSEQSYINKGNTNLKLNIPNLHHGIYFVCIKTDKEAFYTKMIIK